jgi:hypothetical protein
MSTLTFFDPSSWAVIESDKASRLATLAAVQDPAGRNSSTSPDGVTVSRGGVKISFLFHGKGSFPEALDP